MTRSYKKPILKYKGRSKKTYWRSVRKVSKQCLLHNKDIPNAKAIINDYDYCDGVINYLHDNKNRKFWMNGLLVEKNSYILKATRK